jgi:hypothetical protein
MQKHTQSTKRIYRVTRIDWTKTTMVFRAKVCPERPEYATIVAHIVATVAQPTDESEPDGHATRAVWLERSSVLL